MQINYGRVLVLLLILSLTACAPSRNLKGLNIHEPAFEAANTALLKCKQDRSHDYAQRSGDLETVVQAVIGYCAPLLLAVEQEAAKQTDWLEMRQLPRQIFFNNIRSYVAPILFEYAEYRAQRNIK